MEEKPSLDLETYFAGVEDPCVERTKRHKLLDIFIIAICGTICGAEGWVSKYTLLSPPFSLQRW